MTPGVPPENSSSHPLASGEIFSYFSAIEERFNARRGSLLLLSTLDWALIETWREAGVPLAAVLRGIDTSFDRWEERQRRSSRGRSRKVNGLAWCAQAVLEAAEQLVDAATGQPAAGRPAAGDPEGASGFESERVQRFLLRNAGTLSAARAALQPHNSTAGQTAETARSRLAALLEATEKRLHTLADEAGSDAAGLGEGGLGVTGPGVAGPHTAAGMPGRSLEDLDRALTLLEERLMEALRAATPEAQLAAMAESAEQQLGEARRALAPEQRRRVREQIVSKRLLELYRLPRLSLFYMGMTE